MRDHSMMLLRIAQGDAFGMSCEYLGDSPVAELQRRRVLEFKAYYAHPTHGKDLGSGGFSDDAQMSVAVAETIINHLNPTAQDFAESFFRCFKRDPRKGYSKGFQAILEKANSAEEMLTSIDGNSDKNGACMRAVPLGILPTVDRVCDVAEVQATVTHNTNGGIVSAVIVALMSYYALQVDRPLAELRDWLEDGSGYAFRHRELEPFREEVVGPDVGVKTARAVLTLVTEETNLLDIARRVIERGGDTDTVLAVAWGIASVRMMEELPPFFFGGLENGPYGRNFLMQLGMNLMDRARWLREHAAVMGTAT